MIKKQGFFRISDAPSYVPGSRRPNLSSALGVARAAGEPATLTSDEWMSTVEFFDGECAYCGGYSGHLSLIEHATPVGLGGGTTAANCLPSCSSCNSRKAHAALEAIPTYEAAWGFDLRRIWEARQWLVSRGRSITLKLTQAHVDALRMLGHEMAYERIRELEAVPIERTVADDLARVGYLVYVTTKSIRRGMFLTGAGRLVRNDPFPPARQSTVTWQRERNARGETVYTNIRTEP